MSEEKKTLSLKPNTLSLKGKLGVGALGADRKLNVDNNSRVSTKTNSGNVVIVTKSRSSIRNDRNIPNDGLTDEERKRRAEILRNADQVFEENAQKQYDATKIGQTIVSEEKVVEEPNLEEASKDVAQVSDVVVEDTVKQPEIKVEEQPKEVAVNLNQKPKVQQKNFTPKEPLKIADAKDLILTKGKIRNLDSLGPVKKKEETRIRLEDIEPKIDVKKPVVINKVKKPDEQEEAKVASRSVKEPKRHHKISVTQIMSMDQEDGVARRGRSLASIQRAKNKALKRTFGNVQVKEKLVREVLLPDFITIQELASRMSEKAADVIKFLMKMGMIVTVNQSIDADTAELVISELGHTVKRVTHEEIEKSLINEVSDEESSLEFRPPVVTVMGHVDHGKTSLLDALRSTDVVAGEAGGITQHIGAYQVKLKSGDQITFLDTPGHEAFTAMRSRGAKITDIVVLVVAADDGIKPQTVEAINHSKAAQVPIIVAINKIDKPDADPQRVKNELLSHELVPEEMGGDVICVEVSAKMKKNLDKLEECILMQAEMMNLRSNPNRLAKGVVVESQIDKGRGIVATLLVQNGTLKQGDYIVAGSSFGKIRALINDKGKKVESAGPSVPVEILGLNDTPVAGDEFISTDTEKSAKDLAQYRIETEKLKAIASKRTTSLEQLFKKAKDTGFQQFNVVIKGDVQGSVEAIANSLTKLSNDEIEVKILHSGVGGITESDVILANASNAFIFGFNVRANSSARDLARQNSIDIRYYSIIYDLIDDVKAAMSGLLSPEVKEVYLGSVDIREVFNLSKYGKVAGCYVTEGMIKRAAKVRLIRDSVVIYNGSLKALKRFKDDVKEVKTGFECGVTFENYDDMKAGDKIEVYEHVEHERTL